MQTMTLSEVQQLTQAQAEQCLEELENTGILDRPLGKLPKKYHDQIDDIANTWLYLQDHIRQLEFSQTMRVVRYQALEK